MKRLEQLVKESEQGLGSASSHLQSLKDASARLKSELDSTRADLKTSKITAANLKVSPIGIGILFSFLPSLIVFK